MAQAAACGELAQAVHQLGMNVWCYTGYTWEALMEAQDPDQRMFLEQIDVLIDGPFLLAQKSLNLRFRGSANQRLIDVQASLKAQCVVLAEKNGNEKRSLKEKKAGADFQHRPAFVDAGVASLVSLCIITMDNGREDEHAG